MFGYSNKNALKNRLETLSLSGNNLDPDEIDREFILSFLKNLDPKLLAAGFTEPEEQTRVKKYKIIICVGGTLLGALLSYYFSAKLLPVLGGSFLGLYTALVVWLFWLKAKARDVIRSAYFDLPLILEELILLIESGLGLFPALEKVCCYDPSEFLNGDPGICRKSFQKAYSLAVHGMPVSQAFALVSKKATCIPLKQVLIHLDVSASVGGELLTSLRALSDQVHKEWKLQVETRVKRLENLVVFPVFMSVMGLLLLTSAVPLVPVFEFMTSLKSQSNTTGTISSAPQIYGDRAR